MIGFIRATQVLTAFDKIFGETRCFPLSLLLGPKVPTPLIKIGLEENQFH